jgi:hypothetical protein
LAAREADIVGVHINLNAGNFVVGAGAANAEQGVTDEQLTRRLELIKQSAGDRFDLLELHLFLLEVVVTDKRIAAAKHIAEAFGITPEEALTSPYFAVGAIDEIARHLSESRDRYGLSYITVRQDHLELFAPVVERLAGT